MKLFKPTFGMKNKVPENVVNELKDSPKYIVCYWDNKIDDWAVSYDASEEELCYMGAFLQKEAFGENNESY